MDHRFGGQWTNAKLAALSEYLSIYTKGMANQPFHKHYIDAFAGNGRFTHKAGGHEHDGSARIALGIGGFDRYTFIDLKKRHASQLQALRRDFPQADISVIHGDANAELQQLCRGWGRNQRAVVFLDPYGLALQWHTLLAISGTEGIDVWYLFPLNGLLRQMARSPDARDDAKDRALDTLLGTPAWRTELYHSHPVDDLFGASAPLERKQLDQVRPWLSARFATAFPYVEEVAVLRTGHSGSRHGGAALYSLYFMMGNRSKTAIALASKFVAGVRTKLRRENVIA
ncbi:MAG: hypothetical protein DI635_00660 [Pseudoxanthomonas suwonensis]|nr:MAG: hypothetical protein DI635_00660 [Pseudoxanthomonas suwonensis]